MGRASRAKRERGQIRTLYHFTSTYHLPLIEGSGELRLTDSQVPGVGVVWFLDTPTADDAPHGLMGSSVDKKAVRITVRVHAVRWLDWVKGKPEEYPGWHDIIVSTGGGIKAARHWYVSEQPVPRSAWLAVDTLTTN